MKILKGNLFFRQVVLYGIIGGVSAGVDSSFYYLLTRVWNFDEFFANFISINVGITISFILNTYVNFRKTDKLFRRGVSFYSVGYIGLILSMILLYIGINVLEIDDFIIKISSVFIVAMVQFVLNKIITYGKIK